MERNASFNFDDKRYIFLGSVIILLLIVFVIGWGILTKVDTFVVAPGKVVVETYRKPVQYKNWATVTRIFVREGEHVKKGQPLLELEKTKMRSDFNTLMAEYCSLIAERDRLLSEKKGYSRVTFSKEFSFCNQTLKSKIVPVERELFRKDRNKLFQDLAVLDNQKLQAEKRLEGLRTVLETDRKLLQQYEKEIEEQKFLLENHLTTKYRLLDLEKNRKRLESDINDLESRISQLEVQVKEYDEQKQLKVKAYQQYIVKELEDVQSKIAEIKPKISYVKKEMKKTILVAPASGQVIGLKIHSLGEVVRPGDTLMYIVPEKDKVFVLARVFPKDRDRVHVGELVDLRFPSFLSIAANVVEGKVVYVSNDTLRDDFNKRFVYYETHIVLTSKGKAQLKKYGFNLISGMPAVAYIRAEKVTPIEYMIQPVIILMKSAFRAN